MKLKLTMQDRLLFGSLYPQQSNILEQTIIRDIDKKVGIKQEEIKKYKIVQKESVFTWDKDTPKEFEIEFSQVEIDLLKKQVKRLDKKNEISQSNLGLCLKIQNSKQKE